MEPNSLIEHSWNTNSLTVFGILVTILLAFNIFQWKRNQQLTDLIIEANNRYQDSAVDFTLVVRQTLEVVREMRDSMLNRLISNDEKSK